MKFSEIPEFSKELKRLARKYRSLPDDLKEFKKVIGQVPSGTSKHFVALSEDSRTIIIKARLFCRYLRGSSLRIIYAYHRENDMIEFIEMYYKGDKERENFRRIEDYKTREMRKIGIENE